MALGAAGLAAALAGGALFASIPTPIPWLLGPLAFVAGANLAGLRIGCPYGGRQAGQALIGTAIGLQFTPSVGAIVLGQIPWMVIVAIAAITMSLSSAWILRRVSRLDPPTAFFASVPGGMAEMIVIGDKFRAEPVAVTLAQTIRVAIVVILVPAGLTWLGETGTEVFVPAPIPIHWLRVPVLIGAAAVSAYALHRLGMTNAWMLGACAFTMTVTLLDFEISGMPGPVLILGQLLIGTALGERFEREPMRRAPRVILGAAIATAVLLAASLALAAGVAALSGFPVATMIAAASPGGLAEMSITAQVLGLGVPLVIAYHVTRVLMITLTALPLYRLARRLGGWPIA